MVQQTAELGGDIYFRVGVQRNEAGDIDGEGAQV